MPKFESELQLTAVKNASTSNGGIQFSDTSNTLVLHIGDDNRVGIGTDVPESTLHVDGTITAGGLIVPPGTIATATDTADFWGFNPKFDEWNGPPSNSPNIANGYYQTGTGTAIRSGDSVLGAYSAHFPSGEDIIWYREVEFAEPLYANVFIQGTYNYKFTSHSSGEPGFAITLTHRAVGDDSDSYSNTFIAPTFPAHTTGSWQTAGFRAVTPPNREIQKLKISIVHKSASGPEPFDAALADVELSGAAGTATTLTGADNDFYVDSLGFSFMHPDMRIDQEGRITGAYIAFAAITDAHIKNYIASGTSRIFDNPGLGGGPAQLTHLPPDHHEYTHEYPFYPANVASGVVINVPGEDNHEITDEEAEAGTYRYGTGLEHDALVANSTYAAGWAIEKGGSIKATGIKIYSGTGKTLIRGGTSNPFEDWAGASLIYLDPAAHSYLYGLSFEESNSTGLRANLQFLATSGLSNNVVANAWSMYIANTVTGPPGDKGGLLANATVVFNGIDYDAPPGSIFTGGKSIVKNQDAYILFLANTSKWDSDVGNSQKYHANSYLGEYGLYVLGTPTVGGWLYHPHGNNTWYTIDSTQTGDRLHENDFLVIGNIATNDDSEIRLDKTFLQPPKHPDSVTSTESQGSYPPIGITAGGILFADIHLNRYAHWGSANGGQIELTNQKNTPNTRFTFIHPGTVDPADSTMYTVNGAHGVVTSLEDFPGSRYITFIGSDTSRFTVQSGHSPDFVAAFPLGDRWFYNQDEGKYSEFTPTAKDCIVARVDANGSVGALTNIYRYAERELTTDEGATLSDLIIDPPRGMESGGILFAELTINREFDHSTNTFTSNAGFIAITNDVNHPRNVFYAVHPSNGNNFLVDTVGRGIVTSFDSTTDARTYGTRHIAFVGTNQQRFSFSTAYENVANDFVAVTKYDSSGNPRADGQWYYDNGVTITNTFIPDANDFIVATINSYDPSTSGIDQITRWASREGQVIINGVPTTISSLRNILNTRIDLANTAATIAIEDAENAYQNAVSAAANAGQALGLLDRKIVIYYEREGTPYVNATACTDFDYNDLWINTSLYNKFLDGSWSDNAIFRYANSNFGFDDTLAWRHDGTNPAGRAALGALTARDFADRATVIFYEPRSAQFAPFYGPNVAILSTSVVDGRSYNELNKIPEGDVWYDTYGINPTNHPYVYRTNSSFNVSNTTHSGFIAVEYGGANSWAQTVHNSATSGLWNRNTAQTGWWSLQDAAAGNASALVENAEQSAAAALTAAVNAQAAADREINAFFQLSTAVGTASVNATGFGDIWIQTDNPVNENRTPNTAAIFRSNNAGDDYSVWVSNSTFGGSNSAIGMMYLKAYTSGVTGEFDRGTNIMPRAYSTFDAPLYDYKFIESDDDRGESLPPYPIANYETGSTTAIDFEVDTPVGVPDRSLIMKTAPSSGIRYASFANTPHSASITYPGMLANVNHTFRDKYGIGLTQGKKWILSWYSRANTPLWDAQTQTGTDKAGIFLSLYAANSTDYLGYFSTDALLDTTYSIVAANTWQRNHAVFDFTSGLTSDTSDSSFGFPEPANGHSPLTEIRYVIPYIALRANTDVTYWLDSVQLEEVPNTVFTASQFKEPSDASSIVFGRTLLDGKIVTHYSPHFPEGHGAGAGENGPIPNTTPLGYPNPQPDGDFWINTSNNNLVFRYYEKNPYDATIASSQTVYWSTATSSSEDGWYTTEDLRTINALSTSYDAVADAATAQAAADREIIAFFQPNEPNHAASGNGDIWIDTDKYVTLNTSAIYVFNENTPDYEPSPQSAIGQVYLNAYLSGETASRSEAILQNILGTQDLPFPIWDDINDPDNTANGIMGVGATGNVVFHKNRFTSLIIPNPGEIRVENNGGVDFVGPNGKIWYPVAGDFGIPIIDRYIRTGYEGSSRTTVDRNIDGTNGHGGAANVAYLMYSNMNASVRFGSGTWGNHYHFFPVYWDSVATKWIARDDDTDNPTGFEFIPDSANGDFLVAQIERKYVEDQDLGGTGASEIGIHKLEPWIFKTLPIQIKGLGDGKIVTYFENHDPVVGLTKGKYGPWPNTTPSGLTNPNPHGDFWIDTANNNLVFRYHQNTTNRTARSAFHANNIQHLLNNNESGWYSTEDLRVNNAFMQANSAYLLANSAVQDAATAQAAADREILAFFAVETSPPATTTGNGDIWIVTDHAAKTGTRVANTRSIRVANTLNDTIFAGENRGWHEAPNNAIGLSYLKNYITGIDIRALLDGKIVAHYGREWGSDPYFGPDPRYQPKLDTDGHQVPNPYPHSDSWVNTSNNNLEFIFNQNSATLDTEANKNQAYAQTIFWNPGANFIFDEDNDESGWYSTEDDRVANALASSFNANAFALIAQSRADDAYSDAATAQAAADREINAFFSSYSSAPEATGNGDVWIATDHLIKSDGTLNAAAIYVSNNKLGGVPDATGGTQHYWYSSPYNAIGLSYAESFHSGVSGAYRAGDNIMPRALSLFDSPVGDYANTHATTSHINQTQDGWPGEPTSDGAWNDVGMNDQDDWEEHDANRPYAISARYTIDTSISSETSYIGTTSLKVESTYSGDPSDWSEVVFANTGAGVRNRTIASPGTYGGDIVWGKPYPVTWDKYAIDIPAGKRWIASLWVNAVPGSSSDRTNWDYPIGILLGAYTTNTTHYSDPTAVTHHLTSQGVDYHGLGDNGFDWANYTSSIAEEDEGTWVQKHSVLDLTTGSEATHTKLIFAVRVNDDLAASGIDERCDYYIDAIQLEEVPDNVYNPSLFKEPSDASTIVFGRQITDGKIVTRYEEQWGHGVPGHGPLPTVTPTGYPNPEPHGDSWHNTSNNNIIFRYHQNSSINYAQTIFYPVYGGSIALEDPSGWYSTEDPRAQTAMVGFETAISDAANAQAAADREINTFFQIHSSIPSATGNGDIWIQTDNAVNPDGSANIYSIFRSNSAGSTLAHWYQSENNGIGRGFLDQLLGEVGNNWMPRGWSLFDAPITDYSSSEPTIDIVPYPLTDLNTAVAWEIRNDQSPPVGKNSLRFGPLDPSYTHVWGVLASNTEPGHHSVSPRDPENWATSAIPIPPGKRWILSWYAKSATGSSSGRNSGVRLYAANNTLSSAGYVQMYSGNLGIEEGGTQNFTGTDWERHHFVFDFTGGPDGTGTIDETGHDYADYGSMDPHENILATALNRIMIYISPSGYGYTADADYTGFQLEEARNPNRITPSPFQEPSDASSIDLSRAIADGKIVTHYEPNSGNKGNWTSYAGPNPQYTPQGEFNPTPYGDIWVDVANNNLMFRYYQNTINYTSNAAYHANNYEYLINYDESGWYSTEDLRTANLEATTNILTANVNQALADAAFALIASDAEILIFFEPSTNGIMYAEVSGSATGPATGNGDIWIHTDQVYDADGNANTGAILAANLATGIGWVQSPDNAIGRGFLEQFTSIGVKNWFPSGYSMWDADSSEYIIGKETSFNADTPYQIFQWGKQTPPHTSTYGTRAIVNTSFGKVSDGSLQVTVTGGTQNTAIVSFANTQTEAGKGPYTTDRVTAHIPTGKRWIFSYYSYSNTVTPASETPTHDLFVYLSDSKDPTANIVLFRNRYQNEPERNKWNRRSYILDFSNTHIHANASTYTDKWNSWESNHPQDIKSFTGFGEDTVDQIPTATQHSSRLANLDSMMVSLFIHAEDTSNTYWFDGFQLEEAPGARQLAGPFSDPDRQISNHWARALADGKIVTQYEPGSGSSPRYGPRPHVSPSGIPNPAPHGDFWIDTANNNAMYRYNQNNSYQIPTHPNDDAVAQTSFWSTIAYENNKSGWYTIQDGKIGILTSNVTDAFADIAGQFTQITNLEATADGELQIFFETEGGHFANAVNTYSGASYGDLWINTTRYPGEGNHFANGTLSTNAIFRWQNSLSGFVNYLGEYESTTNVPKGLAWRHAPNSAIGQVYLSTYAAQNLADTKITAYFTGNTNGGNEYLGEDGEDHSGSILYGPQTNVTPRDTHNPNPDGDIWINTANNNEMYVYNRDVTAVFSAVGGSSNDATGYAQKVYWSSTTPNEGWYSAEDLRTGSHQLAKEVAEATGTDRHVQILFDTVAPTTTTGNGDIWISTETITNTDGSANLNAIHIANSLNTGIPASDPAVRWWHSEPSSALGRSHLEKLVSEIAKNWVPSEISAFDSPASDYEFKNSFSSEESVQRPISRKNRMHASILRQRDNNWSDVSLLNSTSNVQIEIVSDPPGTRKEPQKTANSYFGNALRIKSGNTADASPPRIGGLESNTSTVTVVLSANAPLATSISAWNDSRIIDIPRGKRWIVSAWFKSYGGYRYNMPSFRTWLKKKYNDDGTANGWSSHIGTAGGEPFAATSHSDYVDGVGWKRNSDYVDGEWIRRHMYLDLSTSDAVGGAQGTSDFNYIYWSNTFPDAYTGSTSEIITHANSLVYNADDAFANISVHPTPIYHFHPDSGPNEFPNTAMILWDGDPDEYEFTGNTFLRPGTGQNQRRDAYASEDYINPDEKAYQIQTLVYLPDPPDTTAYWPAEGQDTTDVSAKLSSSSTEAGNTARVEIITDAPGANSYISGKALHIKKYPVESGGGTWMPDSISVHLANGHPTSVLTHPTKHADQWNHPFVVDLTPERKWVVSYWIKSTPAVDSATRPGSGGSPDGTSDSGTLGYPDYEHPRGDVWLKQKYDPGAATHNTWVSQIGGVSREWDGQSEILEGTMSGLNEQGTAGIWERKSLYLDLTGSNTIYGYGAGWMTFDLNLSVHNDLFSTDGDAMGWKILGGEIAGVDSGYLYANIAGPRSSRNVIPEAYSAFEYGADRYTLSTGIDIEGFPDYAIAGANGTGTGTATGTQLNIVTDANRANTLGVLEPPDKSGASLKYLLPSAAGTDNDKYHQFLFCNVASILDTNYPDGYFVNAHGISVDTFNRYGITIPTGKRWIYSVYIKTTEAPGAESQYFSWYVANTDGGTTVYNANSNHTTQFSRGAPFFQLEDFDSSASQGDWVRCNTVIDLTGDTSEGNNSIILGMWANRASSGDDRAVWYDGFQLEEAPSGFGTDYTLPLGSMIVSNTYSGPSGEESFSGKVQDIIYTIIRGNTISSTTWLPNTTPSYPRNWWSGAFSETNSDEYHIIKWATIQDPIVGGRDGRQTARSYNRHRAGPLAIYDDTASDQSAADDVYWTMHPYPEWRERDITKIEFNYGSGLLEGDKYDIDYIRIGKSKQPIAKDVDSLMLGWTLHRDYGETYIDGIMVEDVTGTGRTTPSAIPTTNAIHETTFLQDHDPAAAPTGLHVSEEHQVGFDGYLYPRVVANVYNTHVTSTSSHWLGRLWWTTEYSDVFGTSAGQYLDVAAPTWQGPYNSNTIIWDLRGTSTWADRRINEVQFQLWSNTEIGDSYNIDYINIDSGGGTDSAFGEHEAQRNEIDAMGFTALVWDNNQDVFIDGIQVEEVTSSNRRAPMINQPPQEKGIIDFSRAIADGKTIYFSSNAFHGDTEDHKYGPSPQFTPEGLLNPTPYGDKWISLSPPYKTYLYFSNTTNQTSQTAYHVPETLTPAGREFADTHWPYGTTNNASGWYEYRDTGDALTQFGLNVKLHKDSIDNIALGGGTYVDGGGTIIVTPIPLPEDGDGTTPTIIFGDPTTFGQNREILLNPVPPSDANLHGHWTLNSSNVDESGNVFVYDVSGRNNHALFKSWGGVHPGQSAFNDHDPAEDFVNVSGNRSLFLESFHSDGPEWQSLILAANGVESQSSYQGAAYPVDSSGFTKQTLTFWYKPTIGNQGSASFVGQHRSSGIDGAWGLQLNGQMTTTNNDIRLLWYLNGDHAVLEHDGNPYTGGVSYLDGWYGANDAGTYTPIRNNEWHFIAIQTDQDTNKQALWIYREGEGLLYYKANTSETISDPDRPLFLNGDSTGKSIFDGSTSAQNANGYYDEVRLYNTMLTPRNIRYLYENPTGRPHQLQPRPGLAVKKGYVSFTDGNWNAKDGPAGDLVGKLANTFAYFHGFDVDGNPADVDPYISFNGQVKYLTRDFMKMYFEADTEKYAGNTGYVMYSDTPWSDSHDNANYPINSKDVHYVFAMPIGANSTQPHTWQYHDYNGDPPFIKFTPDESKHLVVGEVQLANTTQQPSDVKQRLIQSLEVYQFARQPSVVRQSYNFTITPDDFINSGGMENSYLANAAFWNTQGDTDWTFISDLVVVDLIADNIKTGEIKVGVHVGADHKILIDGPGQRIVITD